MKSSPPRLPPWLKVKIHVGHARNEVSDLIRDMKLNTVCQSAKCPNLAECWHRRSATFMILGNRCTRACRFCAIHSFQPEPVDADEPERIAEAAYRLNLQYIVVTSVDRDDLPDKGAGHFVRTIRAIRSILPMVSIEVLTPDFKGRQPLIEQIINEQPMVFNHNLETCERLSPPIRSGGKYHRSLKVLRMAKELSRENVAIKSGIMLGVGETDAEIEVTLRDMLHAGVDILTIGQYLPPSPQHWPIDRYVEPIRFDFWASLAKDMGFRSVASAPLVRSSYKAEELAKEAFDSFKFSNPIVAT